MDRVAKRLVIRVPDNLDLPQHSGSARKTSACQLLNLGSAEGCDGDDR